MLESGLLVNILDQNCQMRSIAVKGFLLKDHKICDIGILQIPDGQSQRRHGTNAQLLPCKRGSSPGTARTTLLKTFGEFKTLESEN